MCQYTGSTDVCFCKLYDQLKQTISLFKIPTGSKIEGFDGLSWKPLPDSDPLFLV